jgi:transposase
VRYFAKQPPAVVILEACGSAHYWGRELRRLGHTVRLLPPHQVRRYVTRNKTDRTDAKALLEAHRNEEIHAVPIKSVDQQAIASLHRLRARWLTTRTARLNSVRGLLREFGVTIPVGAHHVAPQVHALSQAADPESPLPPLLQRPLADAMAEIGAMERYIAAIDRQLAVLAPQNPDVQLLQTIPGIGVLTATGLVALIGDIRRFPDSRAFASYLGLTPKEESSAFRRRLGAISKQGDAYLRMLLLHGARSVLWHAKRKTQPTGLQHWAVQLQAQRGHNIAAVALANKLARIVWAVWTQQRPFKDWPAKP